MSGDTSSSFYTDGGTYDTATVISNDTPGGASPSQAPSSFYPDGTQYQTLANADTLTAEFLADLANATTEATNAATSAIASAASQGVALQNETAAANSAANATAQAGVATTQASNASGSATAAAGSATTATTQAGISTTQATNAASSATTATTQAGIATTQATNSANSATAAAGSATTSTTQAGISTTQATNAAGSATAAATSATNAASAVQSAAGTATPLINGAAAVGTSTLWSHQDHVHPTDTTRAPLASPALTGTPTSTTPTAGDSSTKIATTAFVATSFAPLASPALTGTPTAPTAANGDVSTKIATTAFVVSNASGFPSGTAMLFQQTTAPVGWTKVTTFNDAALRVVSGTAGNGGTNPFSTVMAQTVVGSTTLTTAQIPSHSHGVSDPSHVHAGGSASSQSGNATGWPQGGSNIWSGSELNTGAAVTGISIQANGGGASHNHTITMAMQYVDVIIATKN